MFQNQNDVNEILELVIDGEMIAHDPKVGATETRLREKIRLNGDSESAYEANMDAINTMWRSAVDAAFWSGYKLGRDG